MYRIIQKLRLLVALLPLLAGALVPLTANSTVFASLPAEGDGTGVYPNGTCFINVQPAAEKIEACSKSGYTDKNGVPVTGGGGTKLNSSDCYEIDISQDTSSIDQVTCSDGSLSTTAPQQMCVSDTNANQTVPCVQCPNSTEEEADVDDCATADTALSTGNCATAANCDLIGKYVNPFIDFLTALVGVAVVTSIVVGGIQYSSSGGDPQKTAAAKARIRNAIIALVVFFLLDALLNFLIPGGIV